MGPLSICGLSLTVTSLCGAYLYLEARCCSYEDRIRLCRDQAVLSVRE